MAVFTPKVAFHFLFCALASALLPSELYTDPAVLDVVWAYPKGPPSLYVPLMHVFYLGYAVFNYVTECPWRGHWSHPLMLLVSWLVSPLLLLGYGMLPALCRWWRRRGADSEGALIHMHHCTTVMLVALSMQQSAWACAAFVMFIHSACDGVMHLLRNYRKLPLDQRWAGFEILGALLVWALWAHFRIVRFGQLVVGLFRPEITTKCQFPHLLCAIGLMAIWALNAYWFGVLSVRIYQKCRKTNT